jgi:hypothetical protein
MSLSAELAQKSVQAAISAIEIYNKPNFSYREEAFALLMTNAWELLLKAKWLLDYDEGKKGQTHFSGRTRKNASVPFYPPFTFYPGGLLPHTLPRGHHTHRP